MTKRAKLESIVPLPPDKTLSSEAKRVPDFENFLGAKERLEFLNDSVRNWNLEGKPGQVPGQATPDASEFSAPASSPEQDSVVWTRWKLRPHNWTILKSTVALLAVIVLGWVPLQRLLATTSSEAVVNARVITIRAPIDGEVSARISDTDVGSEFPTGFELLTIVNSRADEAQLNSLIHVKEQLVTTIAALDAKKRVLEGHISELAANKERYRVARVEQLGKRINEIGADIVAARAKRDVTAKALGRARTLFNNGNVAEALVDKAVGDDLVALETINGLLERRKAASVEMAAAQKGTFVSDGYNDTPESAQRGLDAELQLADVNAHLAGATNELVSVNQNLNKETKRQEKLATAVVRSSFPTRIWEVMAVPGQHVTAGQELMRLLDCSSTIVTASVSESVYQKLQVGQRATFRPTGGQEMSGSLVSLMGLASGPSNNAIQPSTLSREPYHVTLKFPGLARKANCEISRSGLVTFDTSSAANKLSSNVSDGQ